MNIQMLGEHAHTFEQHIVIPLWALQGYLLAFGAVTILGGIMGFVKAQSRASLIAGSVSGGFLLLAGVLVSIHLGAAAVLATVVSLALLGRFVPALARGKKMPAIYMVPLAAIGTAVGVLLGYARWH